MDDDFDNAPILGPAREQYSEWLGTIALDDPHDGDEAFYALSGLSRDEWAIVGVRISGGRLGMDELFSAASFYAVAREHGSTFEELTAFASSHNNRLPVVEVGLTVTGLRLLENLYKRWTIHATAAGLAEMGIELAIVDQRVTDQ
jgi:hypothetical protein